MRAITSIANSAKRELAFLARDRWSVAMITWFPGILLLVIAIAFSRGVLRDVPVVIVDHDRSPMSRDLARRVTALQGVYVAAATESLDKAWSQVRSRNAYAVLYIPRETTREIEKGNGATVFVYYNASFLLTSQSAMRELTSAVQSENANLALIRSSFVRGRFGADALPARVQARIMFNPEKSYEHFLTSLLYPAILQLAFSLGVVGAMGRELRDATGPAWLRECGDRPLTALIGKLLPYVFLFLVYGVAASAWLAYRGAGVAGNPAVLILGYLAMYLAYASVASLLIGLTKSMVVALSLTGIYAGVAMAFSGAPFPTIDAPIFTRIWSELMPFTTFVHIQSQQLDIGSDWRDSLHRFGRLAVFVLTAGVIGARLYLRALSDETAWRRR